MKRLDPPPMGGMPYAIGAYLLWGLLPLYLLYLKSVPALEFIGWRMACTLAVCLIVVLARRESAELIRTLGNPKALGLLTLSALLIGGNWLIYAMAIQAGHVFATSLGYYISPLVNVLTGTLFLSEKLSRRQWSAVALAAAGVSLLAWGALDMLGVAIALALTFGNYGLVRRFAPVGSLVGLTIESILLFIPALAILGWYATNPVGTSFGQSREIAVALTLSGALTAAPLLLYATAARRMDYSTLGFVQYLSPTMAFFLGLFVFHEPLRQVQLACFAAIWTAIAIFSWDLWSRGNRANP